MKKIIIPNIVLYVMVMAVMMSSCGSNDSKDGGGSPLNTIKELTEKLRNDKDDSNLTADDYFEIQKQALEAQIEFYKGNPTNEEVLEFNNALNTYAGAGAWDIEKKMAIEDRQLYKERLSELNDLKYKVKDAKYSYERNQRQKDKKHKDD